MLSAWLHDAVLGMTPLPYVVLVASCALLLAALVMLCFDRLRHLRTIEDMPTARVRSAAQGYVELEGAVDFPRTPALSSPLRGIACVWWSYRVEDLAPVAGAEPAPWDLLVDLWSALMNLLGVRGMGRVIEAGRSHEPFLMRDGTGACVVDPDRAEIIGAETKVWMAGTRRCEESLIRVGQPLYALGLFRTSHDHAAVWERRETGELVSTWQLSRIKLGERFDANRDGRIDPSEWQAVWQAATAEVRERRARLNPTPELHVLCDPGDRRPFLLSVLGQRRLAGRSWFESVMGLLACGMLIAFLVWSLGVRDLL
jgi:hypothetical protein